MCGIIAVVRRPSTRPTPRASEVIDLVAGLAATVTGSEDVTAALTVAGGRLAEADRLLRGVPGLRLMLADSALGSSLRHHCC